MALNLATFTSWAARRVYLMIYPYMLEDFMPLKDCERVHGEGNMYAGETPVTHITFRGGQTPLGSAKRTEYESELLRGDSTLEVVQQTGQTDLLTG